LQEIVGILVFDIIAALEIRCAFGDFSTEGFEILFLKLVSVLKQTTASRIASLMEG